MPEELGIEPIIRLERSCSWCHEMNSAAERYCQSCGHEAHVCRMDCRCKQCLNAFRQTLFPPKQEE